MPAGILGSVYVCDALVRRSCGMSSSVWSISCVVARWFGLGMREEGR
jgi:hypothetical protein